MLLNKQTTHFLCIPYFDFLKLEYFLFAMAGTCHASCTNFTLMVGALLVIKHMIPRSFKGFLTNIARTCLFKLGLSRGLHANKNPPTWTKHVNAML